MIKIYIFRFNNPGFKGKIRIFYILNISFPKILVFLSSLISAEVVKVLQYTLDSGQYLYDGSRSLDHGMATWDLWQPY
jgi:hypothetical protein